MIGSDAQLFNTIEKRQNRPPRSTLEPPAMNVNRERDVSWGNPATHLGGCWAPHSTTDSHDWRLTQPVRRSAAPTTQSHPSAANPRLPKFTGKPSTTLSSMQLRAAQGEAAYTFQRSTGTSSTAQAAPRRAAGDGGVPARVCLTGPAAARDAHSSLVTEAVESMAVDAFLRGCKEKLAAYSALNRELATVELAVNLVEGAVTNQQAVFVSTVPVSKLRQVLRFENPTQTQPMTTRLVQLQLDLEIARGACSIHIEKREKKKSQELRRIGLVDYDK
ncbi:hypothetical protein CAPTEDRAFT_217059 [Capitella teleta]|uniref:Uncharacterized protein n=1 Tax=Capitella teleta TaxID=283909 RepID=R7V6X8_CAPTE|nr:hypothetical protein CAPTEDRAFT_217059 [Capitella teleta]|eukprot:ELU14324.1 hypothetical protein CAPTEDRAFT_217059 [Capitella teleta]